MAKRTRFILELETYRDYGLIGRKEDVKMLKSELLEKLKDIAEDADINETILNMEDFAKSSKVDVKKLTIDDYKNMLANNEVIKAYYQSSFDSAVGRAVTNHDEKFKREKLPGIIEEAIKAKASEGLTPEQKQLRELQEQLEQMKLEKAKSELLEANRNKLKGQGLDTSLAKYIENDDDIAFFKDLIVNSVQAGIKEKLGNSNYKPPVSAGDVNSITKEQFNKMNYTEKLKLYNTNKELYDELNK